MRHPRAAVVTWPSADPSSPFLKAFRRSAALADRRHGSCAALTRLPLGSFVYQSEGRNETQFRECATDRKRSRDPSQLDTPTAFVVGGLARLESRSRRELCGARA